MTASPTTTTATKPKVAHRLVNLDRSAGPALNLPTKRTRVVTCQHFEGRLDTLGLEQIFGEQVDLATLDVKYYRGVATKLTAHLGGFFSSLFAVTFLEGRPATLVVIDHPGCAFNRVWTGIFRSSPITRYDLRRQLNLVRRLLVPVQAVFAFKDFVLLAEPVETPTASA